MSGSVSEADLAASPKCAPMPGSDQPKRPGSPAAASPGLACLAICAAICLMVLLSLKRALRLPSGYGIDDFLGWQQPATIAAAVRVWNEGWQGGWIAAAWYVAIDTTLFIPIYSLLLWAGFGHAKSLLIGRESSFGRNCRIVLGLAWIPLFALVLIDLVENCGGFARLGLGHGWWAASSFLGLITFAAMWMASRPLLTDPSQDLASVQGIGPVVLQFLRQYPMSLLTLALTGTSILLVMLYQHGVEDQAATLPLPYGPFFALSAAAHHIKAYAILLPVALLVGAWLVWWYGKGFDPRSQRESIDAQAIMRAAAWGVVGRSRYVLGGLVFFGLLMLGLDQARDVVVALADFSDSNYVTWHLFVLLSGGLSIVMLAYSCWLWTRLAVMVKRPGIESRFDDAWVDRSILTFARVWARALATVPLIVICVLVTFAIGDIALVARRDGDAAGPWVGSVLALASFAALVTATGILLVWWRSRRSLSERSYYNHHEDPHVLLIHGTDPVKSNSPAAFFQWATRPIWLPVIALLLMWLLRGALAFLPDAAASAPPGLAILSFALVWWLGVTGVLAVYENRHGLPIIAAPLLLLGALGMLGWNYSHRLETTIWLDPAQIGDQLALARWDGLVALTTLVFGCLLIWWGAVLLGWMARKGRAQLVVGAARAGSRVLSVLRNFAARIGATAALLAIGLAILGGSSPEPRVSGPLATSDPPQTDRSVRSGLPDDVSAGSVRPLDRVPAHDGGERKDRTSTVSPVAGPANGVILVAAEGGGIRSAYWTAMTLARLHRDWPSFGTRTLLMSGVSGGSIGIAAYRACLNPPDSAGNQQTADAVEACVRRGFGSLDALSPLLGGLMFEDPIGKLLPTKWICSQAGCGYLSRASAFERTWLQAMPELAMPLAIAPVQAPHVAFNSTWVESGNRAVASSFPFTATSLPSASRLRECLRVDLNLIAAAHSSARFPYVNPLAAAIPSAADDSPGCRRAGHLIDGGYFDNSGVATLIDFIRFLRSVAPEIGITTILIRNGRPEPECILDPGRAVEPPPSCLALAREDGDAVAALAAPLDRHSLNLYADELGPLATLYNVSGTGAHGRHAPAQLVGAMEGSRHAGPCGPIRLVDQVDEGALVPLGWYLSAAARRSLDRQLDKVMNRPCLRAFDSLMSLSSAGER